MRPAQVSDMRERDNVAQPSAAAALTEGAVAMARLACEGWLARESERDPYASEAFDALTEAIAKMRIAEARLRALRASALRADVESAA